VDSGLTLLDPFPFAFGLGGDSKFWSSGITATACMRAGSTRTAQPFRVPACMRLPIRFCSRFVTDQIGRAGGLPKTKHFPAEIQRVQQINRKLRLV
jgi:hypothetical protein